MIYDTFENIGLYFKPEDRIYKAIQYVMNFDHSLPDGEYDVEGKEIFAKVASYETSPAEERKFEGHKDYIDVQILLSGQERMDVSINQELDPLGEYDEVKDVTKFKATPTFTSVAMQPGMFVVFSPDDVHRPNCNLCTKTKNRKICMKVKI
jgi:biofilm protein TabA